MPYRERQFRRAREYIAVPVDLSRLVGPLLVLLLSVSAAQVAHAENDGCKSSTGDVQFVAAPTEDKEVNAAECFHFTLLRKGNRNVLLAWGGIADGDYARFREAIDLARPIEEVWLLSTGGDLTEGLEIGRLIRSRGLATRIPRGMACISACNFVFMGGVVRTIDTGGAFITHMFVNENWPRMVLAEVANAEKEAGGTQQGGNSRGAGTQSRQSGNASNAGERDPNDEDPDITDPGEKALAKSLRELTQIAAGRAAEIARYLVEMRLSLKFLTTFAAIPNRHARALTREELRTFNIINTD
jgi:hypothetical protein